MKRVIMILLLGIILLNCGSFAEKAQDALSNLYSEAELLMAQGDYFGAAEKFDNMGAYSDASQMAMYCKAIGLAEESNTYEIAIETFNNLGDFKDSKQMSTYYTGRYYQYLAESYDIGSISDSDLATVKLCYEKASDNYSTLALFKDSITRYSICQDGCDAVDKEKEKRQLDDKEKTYRRAVELKQAGNYDKAINVFSSITSYKDSDTQIKECTYKKAIKIENDNKYSEAIEVFETIKDYSDSKAHIAACEYGINEGIYQKAEALKTNKKYYDAIQVYKTIIDFSDSKEKIEQCTTAIYKKARKLEQKKRFDKAVDEYLTIIDYKDSADRVEECKNKYRKLHRIYKIHEYSIEYYGSSKPVTSTTDKVYYYSKNGTRAKVETTYIWANTKTVFTEDIIIGENGNFISGIKRSDDGMTWKITYDMNNNIIDETESFYLSDGAPQAIVQKYEYNKFGDVIKRDFYRDGKIEERIKYIYTYNDDGSVIQESYVFKDYKENEDKGATMKWIYEYDDMGLLLHKQEIVIEGDGKNSDIYYEYQ